MFFIFYFTSVFVKLLVIHMTVSASEGIAPLVVIFTQLDEDTVPTNPFFVVYAQPIEGIAVGHNNARFSPLYSELSNHFIRNFE